MASAQIVDNEPLALCVFGVRYDPAVIATVVQNPVDQIARHQVVALDRLGVSSQKGDVVGHAPMVDVRIQTASFDARVGGGIGLGVFVDESLQVFAGSSEGADDDIGASAATFGHIAHRVRDLPIRGVVGRAFLSLLFGRDEDFVCGWGWQFRALLRLAAGQNEEECQGHDSDHGCIMESEP